MGDGHLARRDEQDREEDLLDLDLDDPPEVLRRKQPAADQHIADAAMRADLAQGLIECVARHEAEAEHDVAESILGLVARRGDDLPLVEVDRLAQRSADDGQHTRAPRLADEVHEIDDGRGILDERVQVDMRGARIALPRVGRVVFDGRHAPIIGDQGRRHEGPC